MDAALTHCSPTRSMEGRWSRSCAWMANKWRCLNRQVGRELEHYAARLTEEALVAAAGDDVIAFGLIVVRDGALKCVRRRIGHLFSTRGRLARSLSIASAGGLVIAATGGGRLRIAATAGSLRGLPDRQHVLLRSVN